MPKVKDILNEKGSATVSVSPKETVHNACKLMVKSKCGAVLVMQGDKLLGIFTERDLMNKVVAVDGDPKTAEVGNVMTTRIAVGSPDMDINEAAEVMSQTRLRHLPVMDGNQLLGIISQGDLMNWKLRENETTVRHMEDYLYSNSY